MNIGLDFDCVIADTGVMKQTVAREMFGVEVPLDLCSKERIVEAGLTPEQYELVLKETYKRTPRLDPVKDSLFYTTLLKGDNKLKIITSRDGELLSLASKWLSGRSFRIPIEGVGRGNSKQPACSGLDVFIDDDLDKLLPLVGSVKHLLFFRWPFNKHKTLPQGIQAVESWWDIYQYIYYEI